MWTGARSSCGWSSTVSQTQTQTLILTLTLTVALALALALTLALARSRAAHDWAAGHGLHLRAHGHHWGRRRERAGDSRRHPERGDGEPRVSAERDRDGDHLLDHARDGRGLHEYAGDCAVGRRAGLPHHVRGPHGRGAQPQAAHGHGECGAAARPALLRRGAAHPWSDTPCALWLDQRPLPGAACHWVHAVCTRNMHPQHAPATCTRKHMHAHAHGYLPVQHAMEIVRDHGAATSI